MQAFPLYSTIALLIDRQMPDRRVADDRGAGRGQQPRHAQPDHHAHAHRPDAGLRLHGVRDAWIDGVWTYPLPLDASKLSLGKHTFALGLKDNAGNGAK